MGGDMPQGGTPHTYALHVKSWIKKDCNSCRGISNTNSIGRILSRAIKNKLKNMIQAKTSEEQVRLTARVLLR
jgi:hypothetical protein